ncbi:TPA: hypothetical protein HA235_04015 [Candidatus Woesearchaeota archaeon]|nr:hypothetical protein [uncultured archaeon]MBS3173343.1 hypothetical protein [Candidatus Woesearchaeota archaeon]HIH31849.1 hypothetical protein [Candidatus Woesearchaeota archaeon]HIH55438.1 hypothetical protein [Candidatus Woesearchaeota archaeon]HIJ01922.1 hypothetical protein [Candidatus Woesearchaeota archaeon]
MGEEVIRTGVDELLDLLKDKPKIPLIEAARKINIPVDIVQAWVDFLVEERILGIEYKFTTPYIYINQPGDSKAVLSEKSLIVDISYFRNKFIERAKKDNIPEAKIPDLWKNHLTQELDIKKKFFFFEAQQRRLRNIEELWNTYQLYLFSS